ncbi:hypothetical protein [Streptomyces sp. NPDC001652]|uniref:hypothetical protein n=1 Tax=Streptomyces sp. NPDC001652 TaxID=3154393 RepID=UPI003329FA5A
MTTADELYALLPAVHRARDAALGGPLRELLSVLAREVGVLEESLEQMYDDQFIETCAEWAAPYLGDLVGHLPLHGVVPRLASPRAEVANTLRYRRRKGTAAMLEQLARDVTGWPARAVEFFELLATTQYMNHVRPHAAATADLRDTARLALTGTAFDDQARTAEMRTPAHGGRYRIPHVGIFLWRIAALRLTRSPLVAADDSGRRYRIDQLGTDQPLFGLPRTEEEITHLAEPLDAPLPLTVRGLAERLPDHYGTGRGLLLEIRDGDDVRQVTTDQLRICDLSDLHHPPGHWAHEPAPDATHIALDPTTGRVAFPRPPKQNETLLATYTYGSALPIGGGGYDRPGPVEQARTVLDTADGTPVPDLLGAVADGGAVQISDNGRYTGLRTVTARTPAPEAADRRVIVRAAPRTRPLLVTDAPVRLAMEGDTTVVLDGLMLAGGPLVLDEASDPRPRTLILRHCTLVPGLTRTPEGEPGTPHAASLLVLHPFTTVVLDGCVTGPVVAVEGAEVMANDSVIDAGAADAVAYCGRSAPAGGGPRTVTDDPADRLTGDGTAPGGALAATACTLVGRVHTERLDASDTLFLARPPTPPDSWPGPVWAERRQIGCLRFSYVPEGSRTPRRFHCLPDARHPQVRPHHTSLRHGDPGYMQLHHSTPAVLRTGASDESEIGATHLLYAPQRETNLRVRLDEYLRFGLEAGFFFAT